MAGEVAGLAGPEETDPAAGIRHAIHLEHFVVVFADLGGQVERGD
jgi:hypothetical protein